MQLAGLWPAIHEWESKHYSQLQELLALLRLHNATNPELRKGDTAAVWAARYYFYRREQNWEIAGINSRGLKVSILGDELQLNYHIYHYSTERRGYVYFKFAKDWDENSALCTLGAIRLFDERNIQANPDLFSTNLPVQFEYVNLLLDEAHCLTDEQYAVYLREMTSHINQAQERSVA